MKFEFTVFLIIGVLLLAGCTSTGQTSATQSSNTTQTQTQTPTQTLSPTNTTQQTLPPQPKTPEPFNAEKAANIATFTSVEEGGQYRFYFMLEDSNGANTVAAGKANVRVYDDVNNTLYSSELNVKTTDYVDYQFKLTGKGLGKAYEWRVPVSNVKKGISSFWGTAELTFTTSDGIVLRAEDKTMSIPKYSDEELAQIAEEKYAKTATTINQMLTKGSFEVVVNKIGFINVTQYSTTKQYLRVDMTVRNVGSEREYFSPSGTVLLTGQGKQYETSYGGTLGTYSQMYPGITKSGYILFENVPTTETGIKLVFELGHDENYDSYKFQYNLT